MKEAKPSLCLHISESRLSGWATLVISLISFVSAAIEVSVFTATSKTMILRWTRVTGATSYKITVALQSSPSDPIAFATFGPNTVLGSVSSLSPDNKYVFTVEALDDTQQALSSAGVQYSTGEVHVCVCVCLGMLWNFLNCFIHVSIFLLWTCLFYSFGSLKHSQPPCLIWRTTK